MNLALSILETLCYHDIFNYPLTSEEILIYLSKKVSAKSLNKNLQKLIGSNKITTDGNFFALHGRQNMINIRKKRSEISQGKIKKAVFYASVLKLIPSIQLAGISGALAMQNCRKTDDIDFVIITQKNRLWTSRFFANLLLITFKRKPGDKNTKDKACLNLFLDESDLKISPENLYFAHEISQMKVLWDKSGTYKKFLKQNHWVKSFLPNWKPKIIKGERAKKTSSNSKIGDFLENILKHIQLSYMKGKITKEKVGETQLFFHPKNTEGEVLKKFRKKYDDNLYIVLQY